MCEQRLLSTDGATWVVFRTAAITFDAHAEREGPEGTAIELKPKYVCYKTLTGCIRSVLTCHCVLFCGVLQGAILCPILFYYFGTVGSNVIRGLFKKYANWGHKNVLYLEVTCVGPLQSTLLNENTYPIGVSTFETVLRRFFCDRFQLPRRICLNLRNRLKSSSFEVPFIRVQISSCGFARDGVTTVAFHRYVFISMRWKAVISMY